jgi:predicted acyltransferase
MSTTLNAKIETSAMPAVTVGQTVMAPRRVQSIDVLRGITIAFMILVNDPGDWNHVFAPLDHAEWNGWTLTDLVFPTFLFLIGVSLIFSLKSRQAKGNCNKTLTGHVILRALKIYLLGFVLVFFPRMHWNGMRLYGILPRIAFCYLIAGLIVVWSPRTLKKRIMILSAILAGLLLGYWVLLRFVPVPGEGLPGRDIPLFAMNQNLNDWLDRAVTLWTKYHLHTGSLFHRTRDPEGLLSTLGAVASTLMGSLVGIWMQRERGLRMIYGLAIAGFVSVAAGELWSIWLPINKNLWTSSFVLLTAGWAMVMLAALSLVFDPHTPEDASKRGPLWARILSWPWLVYGSNAIIAYVVAAVIVKGCLYYKIVDSDGDSNAIWSTIYDRGFASHGSTNWTSLAFAASFVVVCFLPNWWLWHKKWFLKV